VKKFSVARGPTFPPHRCPSIGRRGRAPGLPLQHTIGACGRQAKTPPGNYMAAPPMFRVKKAGVWINISPG